MINEQTYSLYLSGKLNEDELLLESMDDNMLEDLKKYLNKTDFNHKKAKDVAKTLKEIIEIDKQIVVLPEQQFEALNGLIKEFGEDLTKLKGKTSKELSAALSDEDVDKAKSLQFMLLALEHSSVPPTSAFAIKVEELTSFIGLINPIPRRMLRNNFKDTTIDTLLNLGRKWESEGKKYIITLSSFKDLGAPTLASVVLHELGHVIVWERPVTIVDRLKWAIRRATLATPLYTLQMENDAWDEAESLMDNGELLKVMKQTRTACINTYKTQHTFTKILYIFTMASFFTSSLLFFVATYPLYADRLKKLTRFIK